MGRQTKGIELKWLLQGMFFGSIGNSFVWPLTTIYMHQQLHESLTVSGIVLLFYSGANVVGSYISGLLFDKRNPRHLMLAGVSLATVVIATMIFFNDWPIYAILLTAIGFFNGWIITMVNSFGTKLRMDGRYVFNMLYFANNLGMVIGTTIVGPLYQYAHGNISPLFSITTVLYVLFTLVVFLFFHEDPHPQPVDEARFKSDEPAVTKIPRANLWISWIFFITLCIVWTMYEQWSSNLSVFMTSQGISMTKYSLLWTINGILVVLMQLILTWLNRFYNNPYAQVYVGIFTVGLSFVLLLFATNYLWFVIAMVILTIGEATAFPTMPAIVNTLSPVEVKGKYQGILNAFSSLGKAFGPLFGGVVIGAASYHVLFVICAASIFIMEIIVVLVVWLQKPHTVKY
ncbi:MDR family MFS transporter [Limosilactobacillus kribbianus]|uniref:MDR family MFS transporter n=1 Tax=Limosilactobacillus kribbianus TaxID=2982695 RepID=UPI0022652455|nr:MFS transporter [Limosilactobacillus kribbianus]